MVNTRPSAQSIATDTWVKASWSTFLQLAELPAYEKAPCYYDCGWMRIETMPIGSAHAQDNTILSQVVSLYGTLQNIRLRGLTNPSFRKLGERECQPDLAFYIGSDIVFPAKTTSPVNLEESAPPTLVIEISSTTLTDDLGQKRLLYERLGIQEYWVADVQESQVNAFSVADGGSWQIRESVVLPGLAIVVVEEAMHRSQTQDDGEINRWLIQQFTQSLPEPR